MFQIKGWQENFENHESRKVKGVRWVALPNKHDGKGYRRVAQRPDGVQIFCAWTLILQVASKMPTRGVLADEDGPLDSSDLAAMTGFPSEIFDLAFQVLTEPKIGWLEVVTAKAVTAESCDAPPSPVPSRPAISRPVPVFPGVTGKSALELNGMEGNGREREGTPARATRPASPPSPAGLSEAVKVYRDETGMDPPIHDLTRIEREVTDPQLWRRTVKRLMSNRTPAKNVGTMLDVYHEQATKAGDRTSDARLV
jgi:hypothetical protein